MFKFRLMCYTSLDDPIYAYWIHTVFSYNVLFWQANRKSHLGDLCVCGRILLHINWGELPVVAVVSMVLIIVLPKRQENFGTSWGRGWRVRGMSASQNLLLRYSWMIQEGV